MNNKKRIAKLEVETGLAKLLFYTKVSCTMNHIFHIKIFLKNIEYCRKMVNLLCK